MDSLDSLPEATVGVIRAIQRSLVCADDEVRDSAEMVHDPEPPDLDVGGESNDEEDTEDAAPQTAEEAQRKELDGLVKLGTYELSTVEESIEETGKRPLSTSG